MLCEVCGKKIRGQTHKVIIERAKLVVCSNCAKHGTESWTEHKSGLKPIKSMKTYSNRVASKRKTDFDSNDYLEPIEKFHIEVKKARIKQKLSYEELGRKINEKVSMLKKIEKGKITPANRLLRKLEQALHIKLLDSNSKKQQYALDTGPIVSETTFGDLVRMQKSEEES